MFEDEIESFVLPSMHKEQEHPATPETKETRVQLPKETPKEHQSKILPSEHSTP